MKSLFIQGIGGASGDMLLAAMLDLGVPRRAIEQPLRTLKIDQFRISTKRMREAVPPGLRVNVIIPHSHRRHNGHDHSHEHRGLREIESLIKKADLPQPVREQSMRVFQRLAHAEAHVHGTTPNDVHFHEVGALDAIVDIVGSCLALHHLGVSNVAISPLPLGRGVVSCAHGMLPLPAPATVELLRGFPVETVDETKETVTPTGAALLTTWKTWDAPPAGARLIKSGAGYGRNQLKTRPNVLRVFLLETVSQPDACADSCLLLECQMDDCRPEWIGDLLPRLLLAGALDAYTTPIFMKKQRPGVLLSVLARSDKAPAIRDMIFRETTTFGIRSHAVERAVLDRRAETVTTPFGEVQMKVGAWKGKDVTRAPEYESCAACARKAGVPLKTVYEAAGDATPIKRLPSRATPRALKPASLDKSLPPHTHPHPHPHNHSHD